MNAGWTMALVLACAGAAAPASAQSCGGDLNGDRVVDGADLGLLLGAWNAASSGADINQDGTVDGADLGLLLGGWGPCPSAAHQYGAVIPQIPMTFQTSKGTVTTIGSAELLLSIDAESGGGPRAVHLDRMTFLLGSVPVMSTETGGISLVAAEGPDGVLQPGGQLILPLAFEAHYWLLDVLLPPTPTVCTDVGGSDGFTAIESWNGAIIATLTEVPGAILIEGSMNLSVLNPISGAILGAGTGISQAAAEKTYPGLPEDCAAASRCNKRTVCVQPVFIGTGADDANKTGGSLADLKTKAEAVWSKCCVEIDWKDPVYVNNNAYKTLKKKASGDAYEDFRSLLKERDEKGTDDCIEVFFVSNIQDSAGANHDDGDGDTFGSGTRGAKIIVADGAITGCNPKADGVLAHELGHAMGRCNHPSDKAAAAGTCMEPTGNAPPNCPGVNTSLVKEVQCGKVSKGPLVKEKDPKTPCCRNPDT